MATKQARARSPGFWNCREVLSRSEVGAGKSDQDGEIESEREKKTMKDEGRCGGDDLHRESFSASASFPLFGSLSAKIDEPHLLTCLGWPIVRFPFSVTCVDLHDERWTRASI